ncbi:MAG: SGNH/GDSL hydrolase family protein [Patescibacteria group bacterium]
MKQTICLFGDSITWGAWDRERGGWAARLRSYLETNNRDVAVYNCGVSGDTVADLLQRFDVECKARGPNIIVLSIGINDSRYYTTKDKPETTPEQFQKNFDELLKKAKKYADAIICLGLTKVDEKITTPCSWKPDKYYDDENIRKYDAIMQKSCDHAGVLFHSLYDLLDFSDLVDGLHPSSKGHEKMFLAIKDFFQKQGYIS